MTDTSRLRDLAINESGFIFDPLTGHSFTVNVTGFAVINALKEGRAAEEIVQRLGGEFDLQGDEDLARDVDDFLARLREQGLLR